MNRAERRSRIFVRQPKAKELTKPAPDPTKQTSGIVPILDDFDRMMLNQINHQLPFAKIDEDLVERQTFKDTTVGYIAVFDAHRCESCQSLTRVFSHLLEERSSGVMVKAARLPANIKPVDRNSPALRFTPVCTNCVNH